MKIKYICEKCGNWYDTAEKARACEEQHGELIEVHPMPGGAYCVGHVQPESIYAKFCNEKGEYEAARYIFSCYENTDFETVKNREMVRNGR